MVFILVVGVSSEILHVAQTPEVSNYCIFISLKKVYINAFPFTTNIYRERQGQNTYIHSFNSYKYPLYTYART